MLWLIRGHSKKNRNVADVFRQYVNRHPNKACFIFEDQEWSFQQVKLFLMKTSIVSETSLFQHVTIFADCSFNKITNCFFVEKRLITWF